MARRNGMSLGQTIWTVLIGLLCLAIIGFAGYGVYRIVDDHIADTKESEEQEETDNNIESTAELALATAMFEQVA